MRQATGKSKPTDTKYPVDADTLNQHFANISTDKSYQLPIPKATVNKFTVFSSEECIFHLLDTVRPSATGLDKIPSWFLRIAAPLISVPTAYIFNTSLSFSVVPDQWKSRSDGRTDAVAVVALLR